MPCRQKAGQETGVLKNKHRRKQSQEEVSVADPDAGAGEEDAGWRLRLRCMGHSQVWICVLESTCFRSVAARHGHANGNAAWLRGIGFLGTCNFCMQTMDASNLAWHSVQFVWEQRHSCDMYLCSGRIKNAVSWGVLESIVRPMRMPTSQNRWLGVLKLLRFCYFKFVICSVYEMLVASPSFWSIIRWSGFLKLLRFVYSHFGSVNCMNRWSHRCCFEACIVDLVF